MQIKLFDTKCLPRKSNPNDAAMDVFAREETEWYMIGGMWRCNVPLGFAIECPREYGILIMSRSGMGRDESVTLVNSVGLGDRSFGANEYGVMLIKTAITSLVQPPNIMQYQKIAQIAKVHMPEMVFDIVDDFEVANEKGGFGSSGKF